ncbi:MAG: hypothetical protein AAF738_07375 [Bacteroidota bacterium]
MNPLPITLCLLSLFSIQLPAQHQYLSGHWVGHLIEQQTEQAPKLIDFRLYLVVEQKHLLSGRAYTYSPDGKVQEIRVKGFIHSDRSITLYDEPIILPESPTEDSSHHRKYQFAYRRSAFITENKLSGYWQQIVDAPFDKQRRQGKIELKKVKTENGRA